MRSLGDPVARPLPIGEGHVDVWPILERGHRFDLFGGGRHVGSLRSVVLVRRVMGSNRSGETRREKQEPLASEAQGFGRAPIGGARLHEKEKSGQSGHSRCNVTVRAGVVKRGGVRGDTPHTAAKLVSCRRGHDIEDGWKVGPTKSHLAIYDQAMRTVVLGEAPRELIAAQERRRRHGLDLFDEVWQGEYHMAPAPAWGHGYVDDQLTQILGPYARAAGLLGSGPFNLGDADDYRVPDHGYHRIRPTAVFVATAVVVVEVVSPFDESYEKSDFYRAHGVEELLIVDPVGHKVEWHDLLSGNPIDGSRVLGVTAAEIDAALDWP